MSYAIIRNEKYKRDNLKGIYRHNERKNTNYSNTSIDKERTSQNFHIKKPNFSYEKEFEKVKEQYNLKGQIKTVSNIVCEYIITSDKDFFEKIGESERKRYFQTAHNFVSTYKNLGEQYILSSVVHLDEGTPHMHLVFIPVVHTKNKQGQNIDKIACSEFWKEKDSYRQLQTAFYDYMTYHGFDLDRGSTSDRVHIPVNTFKEVTGYNNIKNTSVLKATPIKVANISELPILTFNRDKLINENIINKLKNQNETLLEQNKNLYLKLEKMTNAVKYAETKEKQAEKLYKENTILKREYRKLHNENNSLQSIVDVLQNKVNKLITWIAKKLSCSETNITQEVEKETKSSKHYEKEMSM